MAIYVNQIGYLPKSKKIAVSTNGGNFEIISDAGQNCVFKGTASESGFDASSGDTVYHIFFTHLTQEGIYHIVNEQGESSPSFRIGAGIYSHLKHDLMKAFYFQRCGCALTEEYAGSYTHDACHTGKAIFFEDYVNHTVNPPSFEMRGGWHDAGDFGRYTTAGAVAVAHLLYAYELFPQSLQTPLQIPETGNGIPDILNECLYELTWLLKMQAPDGGVYHKLTSFSHADFIMPEEDDSQFLIYPVSSMAAADFAAVMALAHRIYRSFVPDFSQKALAAARKAWEWLSCHPYVGFHNPEGSNTGEYDDDCDLDERMWAAAELLRSDGEHAEEYRRKLMEYSDAYFAQTHAAPKTAKTDCFEPQLDFGWTNVSGLAAVSVLFDEAHSAKDEIETMFRTSLLQDGEQLFSLHQKSGYCLAMLPGDFCWGSNMVVCNRSILLILCSLLKREDYDGPFRQAALEHLHYLLGRNALHISYVTGHGQNAFRNPHNRPTFADGIELPMPGWVSGGPNKAPCDPAALRQIPQGTPPMKCYVDDVDSYSTNEITIYWNSPAVFMTAYFESLPEE